MAWARYDDRFPGHWKVSALRAKRGKGPVGAAAVGLHVLANCWSRSQGQGGFVPEYIPDELVGAGGRALAEVLASDGIRLFDPVVGGWMVHDFDDYSPKYDPEQQRANGRKGGRPPKRTETKPVYDDNQFGYDDESASEADDNQTSKRKKPSRASVRRNPDPDPDPLVPTTEPTVPPSAQTIIREWVERCRKRPPGNVIGQTAKIVKQLLDEGVEPDDIRRGMADWNAKGLHPSSLPALVHQAMNAGPQQSAASAKAQGWLDLGNDEPPAIEGKSA